MSTQALTYLFVGLSFALYIGIAIWSRAKSTSDFYIAGKGVNPIANGMATAADWMSAASFISMAGLIAFMGKDGSVYLMGWTGGYVLLALLLAPYLRKFGQFTVPDFIGTRYYSKAARLVAVVCLIFVSFTYVAGQMRGVGIVFSRFLEVDINVGVIIGMAIVFFYAVLGGMKGITYTQVAQYCVLIFAYLVPAIFISILMTGNPVPQLGFGDTLVDSSTYLLDKLDQVTTELGFLAYTESSKSTIDIFCITAALMFGTAGLPHVIVRFFTVPTVQDARKSAGYALIFIALLYTTAPAVGAFARMNFIDSIQDTQYSSSPSWFKNWEGIGLIAWNDKNNDGIIHYSAGNTFEDNRPQFIDATGDHGQRLTSNTSDTSNQNEVYIDKDIMVLANPEIAKLPGWVIALVAAGGLAAALSTAAGLLLVISSSISHDLLKKTFKPNISEKQELFYARCAAAVAIVIAGLFGIFPPGFVAQVVAFAFGLAAATIFPALFLGIFSKSMNKEGAIAGMVTGLVFTSSYIIYYKFLNPAFDNASFWIGSISPEGIGFIGMLMNFFIAIIISRFYPKPPKVVSDMVTLIRQP
ncbi:cation acetate symporter [Gammaproteobacteria bacterium]|nr:cation acetate symporter [Gammaproteobacteria bacterium]MDA9973606.1 cation acetate symporter [Gammaproteobacteria bacterium]MDB4210296.1 cation acetate symporter [Gammaproteobacteria bacterium]MDB4277603.1 cation acetate symporter [Gammaproteobacteria bacterium]MDB9700627.1 cation acetate symporter [Gammaproteobacteria bacterium]